MTFNVVLPGVTLANVGYKWLTAAGFGAELNAGVTDTSQFYTFLIDAVPPAGALEIFAYDVNDHSNSARGNYVQVAIKSVTDQFVFTVPNQVDANTQSINDVTITGDGQPGTEFGV